MLEDSIILATNYHSGQLRKHYNLPYIVHPLEVMIQLKRWDIIDHDILSAAVCHDLLEDTNCSFAKLEKTIGAQAARYVDELTYYKALDSKQEYLKSFETSSKEALMIKIADRICNLKDFEEYDPEYVKKYYKKSVVFFDIVSKRSKELPNKIFNKVLKVRMQYEW